MAEVFKVTEVVGTSPTSFAEAVRVAVAEGKVAEFQVTIKIGFKLER